ncbi:MAG TPA: T9SS type A sorting domain-containing protein [Bacteroidia bacterium]|jgi:hypothetical protein|nr:T9SS type A sorting domain-containing protein [Bacteroidia bacterium]
MRNTYLIICMSLLLSFSVARAGNMSGCSVSISSQNCSSCNACDGTATGTPAGTSGPVKTYSWSPSPNTGQGTPTAGGLCAGTYTLTITDSSGCTTSNTITISKPSAPTSSAQSTNLNCNGTNTGAITVTESGGKTPYTYSWHPAPGSGQGTANATHMIAGTYTCNITDANGCHTSIVDSVTQPPVVKLVLTSVSPTCDTCKDGKITGAASGGVPGYTYSWEFITATGCCPTGLAKGTYTCCVQDAHHCQTCNTVVVSYAVGIVSLDNSAEFSLFPNPFQDVLRIELGPLWKEAELGVYNVLGELILKQKIYSGSTVLPTESLRRGIYFISVTSPQGNAIRKMMKE